MQVVMLIVNRKQPAVILYLWDANMYLLPLKSSCLHFLLMFCVYAFILLLLLLYYFSFIFNYLLLLLIITFFCHRHAME